MSTVLGTIRWKNSLEWMVLEDKGHTSLGINSVVVMNDRVRVMYNFVASKVLSMHVTPDDTFASVGVRCGASVGLSYADIYFFSDTSTTPIKPSLLSNSGANIWIAGWFVVEDA